MAFLRRMLKTLICIEVIGLLLGITVVKFRSFLQDEKTIDQNQELNFSARHLMSVDESAEDITPVPSLEFWLTGETTPKQIDSGSILTYNWMLTHKVEPKHTSINVTFQVDFPFLTFLNDSLNISLSSQTLQINTTEIFPTEIFWLEEASQIEFSVDLADWLWINLTKPWSLPDCWWTPGVDCYETTYEDCIFYDTSEEQNWDPTSCYHFNLTQCLPYNTTSECFFLHPYHCLTSLLNASEEEPNLHLCPIQPNTSCIQINDRGLYFTQYDWTIPTKAPILQTYEKEFCGMSTEEIWIYEEDLNGTIYIVDIFVSEDTERDCRTVSMKLKPLPPTPEPTYNPYKDLPITSAYAKAKECLNVNTTGFYIPPPEPILWQDFNLSVYLTGEVSNFVEINQKFVPILTVNITQSTKPPSEQITTATATMEYTIYKPGLKLKPKPSFSEIDFALKHEQIFFELLLTHTEALNHGIEITVTISEVDGEVRMAFLNETPSWTVGKNLIATTNGGMFNATSDESGHEVTHSSRQATIAESRAPGITYEFSSSDEASGAIDKLTLLVEPFIAVQDLKRNVFDRIDLSFNARVLTYVDADQILSITAKATYPYTRDDFFSSNTPKLTITKQPFIPLIPPEEVSQSPDASDLIRYTFDLSHILDFQVYDIWMNVSCPDLQIVPDTLQMEFLEPDTNTTNNSSVDLSFTTVNTYHIHLSVLAPEVNFLGNQTFLMWNNSMLTEQTIVCNVQLSYRKDTDKALILPYQANLSPPLTLPGISYDLYAKDLLGSNETMYYMPVGSNATFIVNITFPETSTKLDVTVYMPVDALAVYYVHVIQQGTRLSWQDNGTIAMEITNKYIDDWDRPARSTVHLDFGMMENLADNKEDSTGDNLVLEFNVVLLNTSELVTRDTQHTLSTSVSYSNGEDLVEQEAIHVWEPDVVLALNMSNDTNAGDSGDVFEYSIYLSHTELSQSAAHHVLIEIYLPFMAVYRDFIPSNDSRVPKTRIYDGLGPYEADGKLWLYLYKMAVDEVISGNFLIQISTKLTEGIALLATTRYHMYSFYQWGRVYHYTGSSANVINIRNATLIFAETSQSQTPEDQVAIHEQVTYTMRVPVPPIPSNLSVALHLPRYPVFLQSWRIQELRESIPRRPPVEETFLRQGCFPSPEVITDACFCSNPPSMNGTFYKVYPDWLTSCEEIPRENCTGVDELGTLEGNQTQELNSSCSDSGNCSLVNQTIPQDSISPSIICRYHDDLRSACVQSVLERCLQNSTMTTLWDYMYGRLSNDSVAKESSSNQTQETGSNQTQATPTYLPSTNQSASNQTQATPTQLPSTNQSASNQTQATPTHLPSTNQTTSNQTAGNVTATPTPQPTNHTTANQTQSANQTADPPDEYSQVMTCADLAEAFCEDATLHECVLPESVYNETGRQSYDVRCACSFYQPPPIEPTAKPSQSSQNGSNITTTMNPYADCRSQMESVALTIPSIDSVNTTTAPSIPSPCDEEEEVMFGMASVVHTEIESSREGSVCTFVGGNRHDPFTPGVYYISEHLPANLTEGGSTIQVNVTMVVLDRPELTRGDILLLNATSAFSYVSYPVPPSDIFRENCTCRKPLEAHFDPFQPLECFCESWHLHNVTVDRCNCSSYYVDEGDNYPASFSCNCISFCWRSTDYFLNPPHVAALEYFDFDVCDCASLNHTLSQQSPSSSIRKHADSCLDTYLRNYTCHNLTHTLTQHKVPFQSSCLCQIGDVDSPLLCDCETTTWLDELQRPFQSEVTVLKCLNQSITTGGSPFQHTFNNSECTCSHGNETAESTSTVSPVTTPGNFTNYTNFTTQEPFTNHTNSTTQEPFTNHTNSTTQESSSPVFINCTCQITCEVSVDQDCLDNEEGRCANITQTRTLPLPDSTCKCRNIYKHPFNISTILDWYQPQNLTRRDFTTPTNTSISNTTINATSSNETTGNITSANQTMNAVLNLTDVLPSLFTYELECDCSDIERMVYHVQPPSCQELPAFEEYDCDCFVPPDNHTQFVLDNWDYNATIVDQMITRESHQVVIVEPELQITFTRRPEPTIVDSIDLVIFDFEITHTPDSDAPAFNVTLQLDAVNFTRNLGFADLEGSAEEPSCIEDSTLCQISYDNAIGRFHLPLLPVDPPDAVFKGTFNLSVGNHIDFVANSLIAASAVAWYDSSIVDFPGRLYPTILASDTVQIDAPTISAHLDFNTAYGSVPEDPPKTFSIGDYVRMEARLWMPEVTLQLLNFSQEAVMQNITPNSIKVELSERIYYRNDTPSIFLETNADVLGQSLVSHYSGQQFNYSRFMENGVSVIPGVLVNEADNIADQQDSIHLLFTFRVQDVPFWFQGVEIPFTISATYLSSYERIPTVLVDDSMTLMVVEPKLSLRVEILDYPWQIDQVMNSAEYTCTENTCCSADEECGLGTICATPTEDKEDCASSECRCYSGFAANELEGCTAVGRTAGDVINYGLTATHHVDYTGNAFDVFIRIRSDLPSDLIPGAHFISHPPGTAEKDPRLTQLNDWEFQVYVQRFDQLQMCERILVPHRIRPEVEMYPGKTWKTEATMLYYSAKPYGTTVAANTESRLYHFEESLVFNLTAPAPSGRFYMLPYPQDSSSGSAVDFRVYSSSESDHGVTVNVRGEGEVRFGLEVIVPKIKSNLTLLLALPKGDGFKFEAVRIASMGSRILFPSQMLSNHSLTTDLDGNQFFYAELPDVYSVPYTIDKQREFNSTIQRRFKTMQGELQPYPTMPSCTSVNTTLYETTVSRGCFHDDREHFFDVAVVTEGHAQNGNLTKSMTRELCFQMCRGMNLYISATKNGTDCYCGNHSSYYLYRETAHSLYTQVNRTILESYEETINFDCNKTVTEWTYHTVTEPCLHLDVYDDCKLANMPICMNQTLSECRAGFTVDCESESTLLCNGTGDSACVLSQTANCTNRQGMLCASLAERQCEDSLEEECLEEAKMSYHLSGNLRLTVEAQSCCLDLYLTSCLTGRNLTCAEPVTALCSRISTLFENYDGSFSDCIAAEMEKCVDLGVVNCTSEGREVCLNTSSSIWNDTGGTCDQPTIALSNVTTANCTSHMLPNCSSCLYDSLMRCEATSEGSTSLGCIEASIDNCTSWCMHETCEYEFHDLLIKPRFSNCSRLVGESYDVIRLVDCSQDITKWQNVTREVMETEPVTMDQCNAVCSGNPNSTCGGEDFVLIYGPLEGALAQQQCEWYAGLYDQDEDVFTLEFEMSVSPLLTKGVTEILQPFLTYDHGSDRIPTTLPFAPFRLEAGDIWLDMNVWIAPETTGFVPGDLIEFYTEVFHSPTSTVTARDVSVVWLFPSYVEYINLTNHKTSLHDFDQLQPVQALRTDPTKGFQFFTPTLRNTDMISFHFLIKLDPEATLPQGEYHMVALAETYYTSWDLYNPHEDEFKHNVLKQFHDIIPTKISFEVPTTYLGRPELEELKLATYNTLYDEINNIMYACFFNNTKHVYAGGCFMTGNLPGYETEVPPTCAEYCNCTYEWDLSTGSNCSEFEPKPENCSCGCLPDCSEVKSTCDSSCYNCTWCSYEEVQICLTGCRSDLFNCTQDCCLNTCSTVLESCLLSCSNCSGGSLSNCSSNGTCTLTCSLDHGHCSLDCLAPPSTCSQNCSLARHNCREICQGECQDQLDVYYPGVDLNCTELCDGDCLQEDSVCSVGCCMEECRFNSSFCLGNCEYTCQGNSTCLSECLPVCNSSFELCVTACNPPYVPCNSLCDDELSLCAEGCNKTCEVEICFLSQETNCSDNSTIEHSNVTSGWNYTQSLNHTSSNETLGCVGESVEHCYMSTKLDCFNPCQESCSKTSKTCKEHCCLFDNTLQCTLCFENCSDLCGSDGHCLQTCAFSCADSYDRGTLSCIMPTTNCRPDCQNLHLSCQEDCLPCGGFHLDSSAQNTSDAINATNQLLVRNQTAPTYPSPSLQENRTECLNGTDAVESLDGQLVCGNTSTNITGLNTTSLGPYTNQASTDAPINCSVEVASCRLECNATLGDCIEECPCDEPCFQKYSGCWTGCYGCEPLCLGSCHSNCSAVTEGCIRSCVEASFDPVETCSEGCITDFKDCVPTCIHNITVNISRIQNMNGSEVEVNGSSTKSFFSSLCLDGCVSTSKVCLTSCQDPLAETNCTNRSLEASVQPTDACSIHCYAYLYGNSSHNETLDSYYQECWSACMNWTHTQNTSDSNISTSSPTEATSTDSAINSTSTSGSYVTISSSQTTPGLALNVTSTPPTLSNITLARASQYSPNCTRTFSDDFETCSLNCTTMFDNCTAGCLSQNSSSENLNNSVSCAQDCGMSYQGCSLGCAHQVVIKNCSAPCTEANRTCLEACGSCLECREPCQQDCNDQKSICLDICYPQSCQDIRSNCLFNCSVCDCVDPCQGNCSSEAENCLEGCSPEEVTSCGFGFYTCLSRCSPLNQSATNISLGFLDSNHTIDCVENCILNHSLCSEAILVSVTTYQNCTVECLETLHRGVESGNQTGICNITTGGDSGNASVSESNSTAVACNISSDVVSNCDGLCKPYKVFNECASLCNSSRIECLDSCRSYLNQTTRYKECPTQCIDNHTACFSNCFITSIPSNCTRNCTDSKTSCLEGCTNCSLCPECSPACEANYINCTSTMTSDDVLTNTSARSFHPNCTSYQDCLSLCSVNVSAACADGGNCTASNCSQLCLKTFISPICTSQSNCSTYDSLCVGPRRKRRSVPDAGMFTSGGIDQGTSVLTKSLILNEMKLRFLKELPSSRSEGTRQVEQEADTSHDQDQIYYSGSILKTQASLQDARIRAQEALILLLNSPSQRMETQPRIASSLYTLMNQVSTQIFPSWLYSSLGKAAPGLETLPSKEVSEDTLHLINLRRGTPLDGQSLRPRSSHHIHRRNVNDSESDESFFNSSTSNTTSQIHYSYPICSSNEQYLHHLSCLNNCSILTSVCRDQCTNFSLSCNCSLSNNSSNCSLSGSGQQGCNETTVEECVKSCTAYCTDTCEESRPSLHRECYSACNHTTTLCSGGNFTIAGPQNSTNVSESSGNCSSSGIHQANSTLFNTTCGSTSSCNASDAESCSTLFGLTESRNVTECLRSCDESALYTDCLQACDNSTCAENATCDCNCTCSVHPNVLTNQTCSYLEWTNGVRPCFSVGEVEVCTSACGCIEAAKTYPTRKWRALHSNVGNLLGWDPSKSALYGLSHNGLAVLRSQDVGVSWVAVATSVWEAVRASEAFVPALSLGSDILQVSEPKEVVFTSSSFNETWGVSGVGIHWSVNGTSDWQVAGTWQCCRSDPLT